MRNGDVKLVTFCQLENKYKLYKYVTNTHFLHKKRTDVEEKAQKQFKYLTNTNNYGTMRHVTNL